MTKVDAPKKLGVNINSFSCVIEKIQIIPLEHHVIDLQYIYLWAMFRANKKCGYIQLQAKEKEYDLIVKLMCGY